MRTWRFFLAVILGALAFSTASAEDDLQSAAAIRELVRRGAVVKKFAVIESETQGLLVRLKAEHIDRNGKIDADILATLQPLKELSLELRGLPLSDAGLKSLLAKDCAGQQTKKTKSNRCLSRRAPAPRRSTMASCVPRAPRIPL